MTEEESQHAEKSHLGYTKKNQAADRRALIKKIIGERGFSGIIDLSNVLEKEYNIKVTRKTLYSDIGCLGGITETDAEKVATRMIAALQMKLNNLNDLINNTDDERNKISAIRAYASVGREIQKITQEMSMRDQVRSRDGKKQKKKEDITVKFEY